MTPHLFQTPDLMGSRNTNNSRCFFLTKHKIRDSAKSTLCEYVAVVYTSIQNIVLYKILHFKTVYRVMWQKTVIQDV
jgi:hypothetical protein